MKYLKLYEAFHNYSPLGFIDSGYGGMAIMEAVKSKFPEYDYQFLGVSPNTPLSTLETTKSTRLVELGIDYLTKSGCTTGVVACNTACTLVQNLPPNWVNLVKETVKYVNGLQYNNIAVLATPVTINSGVYQILNNATELACAEWAKLVEEMRFNTREGIQIIKSDLDSLFSRVECDVILLACTHYILLKPIISKLYPGITIISQDDIIVDYFLKTGLSASKGGSCKYLTCGSSPEFDSEVSQLFGISVKSHGVVLDNSILESRDPEVGTGKKPKGSGRRLYTDENPNDTVPVKFKTLEDIRDTVNSSSFKSKSHKRQSQILNLIEQRVRVALSRAKDPDVKKRLKRAHDYIKKKCEMSKEKTKKMNLK